MVGVPGRSKACHTCKQRRIACGLQKPQCAQCIKSNRLCGGYQRDRIFVLDSSTSKRELDTYSKPLPVREKVESAVERNDITPKAQPDLSSSVVPQGAYRQQLLSNFLSCQVPRASRGSKEQISWLYLLPEQPTTTRALETSIMALCTAKLGRSSEDTWLVKESLKLYTQGLRQLQNALWDPDLMYKDGTLAACMALAMYEIMECPSESKAAYASHQQGCAKLIQLRGAEAHSSGLGHQIFLTFRVHGVLDALEHHQPTYLSDPTWTEKPWMTQPKKPFDRLFDFFVLAPEIFKQADQLGKLDPWASLRESLKIVNQCWEIDNKLEQFFKELQAAHSGPLYWPELSRESNAADDVNQGKVFPVMFRFIDPRTAVTLIFYWSTLLMLWSGMCRLYQHIYILNLQGVDLNGALDLERPSSEDNHCLRDGDVQKSTMGQLSSLAHRADFASVAWNVCQSIEYCLQDEMLGSGPSSVTAPLHIVLETIKPIPVYGRQVLWTKATLEKITGRGMRILKYL